MTVSWYAMRSKPNKEDFLARQLEAYNVDFFYPHLQVNPVNPRARKKRPYFPNYLFIHTDLDVVNTSALRWMPGASGLVSFDGEPASVPDPLIDALKRQIDLVNTASRELVNDLKSGDPVIVQDGPFAGYEAIFDVRLPGHDRVRILLNFLQARQVPVELQSRQVRRMKRP